MGCNFLIVFMVANKVIHEAKSKKKATLVYKADFEKAYKVLTNNSFLYDVQNKVCSRWI